MADGPLILCRCEGVTLDEVREAVRDLKPSGLRELKLVTRLTMGICQGRVCRPVVEALGRELGLESGPEALPLHPPFRPTSLGRLGETPEEATR